MKRLTKSTGAVDSTVTAASGEITTTSISADGLDSASASSCGTKVKSSSDLDSWFDHTNVESTTMTTPAGLSLTTSIDWAYGDSDADGQFESVTNTVAVNNKAATVLHDVVNATRKVTSPEGRTITTSYDPNTLLPLSTAVPGCSLRNTITGRRQTASVTSGTRKYTYIPAAIATITDPTG
jgi:hypothetical protein